MTTTINQYSLLKAAQAKGLVQPAVDELAKRSEFSAQRRPDAAARKWLARVLENLSLTPTRDTFGGTGKAAYFDASTFDTTQMSVLANLVNSARLCARAYGSFVLLKASVVFDQESALPRLKVSWEPY